ncbi:transcription termination/antitermination protein NusA, partial [Mycobacterium timonense]
IVDETNQSTVVVVPDYQLSLAIGKRGQNARLAAKLTGWKIDIKSETDAREVGIYPVVEAEKVTEEDIALEDAYTTESTEEVNDVSVETN